MLNVCIMWYKETLLNKQVFLIFSTGNVLLLSKNIHSYYLIKIVIFF